MSLKKNIFSNYIGKIYGILATLLVFPLYLYYLNNEGFGLVSLFPLMQTWLRIFDMGLMPALSREVAYHFHQKDGPINIRHLIRFLEIFFLFINLLLLICVFFGRNWIAWHWLKIEEINHAEVSNCIFFMGMIISLRWFSDLYRAGIAGMEKQTWLNFINIVIVTFQYGGGYLLISCISRKPIHFFSYQLAIAIIELIILNIKIKSILPTSSNFLNLKISRGLIKQIFPFALSIAYTSILWTILIESNKLLLSHILPLSTYGHFALVTIIAGGILQLSIPICDAILPRMTALLSTGKKEEMLKLYRDTTQIVTVLILSVTGIIATFSKEIIYVWTGNDIISEWGGPILFWYALGNGIMSISAFQYYLQFVHGKLKFHVVLNTIFTIMVIPFMLLSALYYGAIGTGISWFLMEATAFLIFPFLIHQKYAPGLHKKWLLKDILPISLMVVGMLILIKKIPIDFTLMTRNESFIILCVFTMMILIVSAMASSTCRGFLVHLQWKNITREKS